MLKKGIACMLALMIFSVMAVNAFAYTPISADEVGEQTLEELMNVFMEENGLNENNFSICYYNTVT